MNCSKIQNLLSAYMDGELTGVEQLQIRRHLESCLSCAEEHESLLTTKRMISTLSVRQARPDLEQMILGALAEESDSRSHRSPILAWWFTLPMNRRLQFASVLALGAVALAAARIVPVMNAPDQHKHLSGSIATSVPVGRPAASHVGEVLYIHNPMENMPSSGGTGAVPVSLNDFSTPRGR